MHATKIYANDQSALWGIKYEEVHCVALNKVTFLKLTHSRLLNQSKLTTQGGHLDLSLKSQPHTMSQLTGKPQGIYCEYFDESFCHDCLSQYSVTDMDSATNSSLVSDTKNTHI